MSEPLFTEKGSYNSLDNSNGGSSSSSPSSVRSSASFLHRETCHQEEDEGFVIVSHTIKNDAIVESGGIEDALQFKESTKAAFIGAAFNLSNATIGSGVLGLPFVLREVGLVLGLFFVVAFAFIVDYSIQLLHRCSEILIEQQNERYLKERSYESIGHILYGKWGGTIVKICVILINFGAMISYLIIIGDLILTSFLDRVGKSVEDDGPEYFWVERPFVVGMITLFILYPLSLVEKMSTLYLPSLLSMLSVLGFIIIVIIYYFIGDAKTEGDITWAQVNLSLFEVLPIIIFAYSCHTNLMPIARDFTGSPQVLDYAIHLAVFICCATYATVATFGYISFYDATKGDLVLSYPSNDYFIDTIKMIMALSIITTVPMVTYPCRFSLDNLLFPSKEVAPHRYLQFLLDRPRLRSALLTALMFLGAFLLSIFLPSVTFVFSLTGSTSSTLTSFIFPCLFYLKLEEWHYWWEPKVLGSMTLLIAGLIFGTLATVITIVALFIDF